MNLVHWLFSAICCWLSVTDIAAQSINSRSYQITVNCQNLSEELSAEDDLVLLIYSNDSESALDSALFIEKIQVHADTMTRSMVWHVEEPFEESTLFLVEQDQKLTLIQLDAIFRVHRHAIMNAFDPKSSAELVKYLGKDDLLGFETFTQSAITDQLDLMIKGEKLLDWYKYSIRIERASQNFND